MTTWQAMYRLEELGYSFELTDGGKVQGRIKGEKPLEASTLLAIARADRDSAADYVQQRNHGVIVVSVEREVTLQDTLAVGLALRAGEAELMGKVRLSGGRIFITWMGAELPEWVEKAHAWAWEEMIRLDESPYWEMTSEEYDKMCARYCILTEIAGGVTNE